MATTNLILNVLFDKIEEKRSTETLSIIGQSLQSNNQMLQFSAKEILDLFKNRIETWVNDNKRVTDAIHTAFISKIFAMIANLFVINNDSDSGQAFFKECDQKLSKHPWAENLRAEISTYKTEILDKKTVDWYWVE